MDDEIYSVVVTDGEAPDIKSYLSRDMTMDEATTLIVALTAQGSDPEKLDIINQLTGRFASYVIEEFG